MVATDTITHSVQVFSTVLYKTGKQDPAAIARAMDVMDDFCQQISRVSPHDRFAWIELPLVGRGGVRSTLVQAYIGGIIRGTLHRAGFVVYDVNQSTWKAKVCGNGRSQKEDVLRTVKVAWPKAHVLVEHDGDLTDAAAIALFGTQVLGRGAALSAPGRLSEHRP